VLLPKKLLVLEEEMLDYELKELEKLQGEENVQLLQEKVLEEKPGEKVLEEKLQGDLLEGEDARTPSFFILFWYKLFILLIIYIQYVEVSIMFPRLISFRVLREIARN